MSEPLDVERLKRIERALSELAQAILRHEYAKSLHNIALLEAIAADDPAEFDREWAQRHE